MENAAQAELGRGPRDSDERAHLLRVDPAPVFQVEKKQVLRFAQNDND